MDLSDLGPEPMTPNTPVTTPGSPTRGGLSRPTLSLIRKAARPRDADQRILLTGATGFVGGELLLRLLARDERRIICLVRGADDATAAARGAERMRSLLGREPTPTEMWRVRWIRSDLEKPRLGLSACEWRRLSDQIDEIFHCAASVDFDLPLADAQRINVDGVRELLDLAGAVGRPFRRFHHVSTAYVSGETRGRVTADYLPSDRAKNFRNTYERTKARAERLLRDQKNVSVSIYRPSIIAGDTDTGRTDNWNVIYVPMRQMITGRLPMFPVGGLAIADTVGVDFVVDGIVEFSKRHDRKIQAYHLTADRKAFDLPRLVRNCNKAAQAAGLKNPTQPVSQLSFRLRAVALQMLAYAPKAFPGLRKLGMAASKGIQSFAPYLPYTTVSVQFDATWEHDRLAKIGISMPDPDIYLGRIIEYAVEENFGHARIASRGAAPISRADEPMRAEVAVERRPTSSPAAHSPALAHSIVAAS